jgi:hypothetical protein
VTQLFCKSDVKGEQYSLWAKLTGGEELQLTGWRYAADEIFFIKRAVEMVLGIQDRPMAVGEDRPFGPHDRLALPATLKPPSTPS